ncbi:hypothetical protein [Sorangium cellulosum]|uniref:Uncharacterized protein n=1 Tax=Sorangium cellulosum So0157-2 TaxID=1254432 RepID=S4XQS4_SORCE|nr:hypothetical protein [Sorangium cellulosum]AGP34766.1 hypothetical protein SCE1572_09730 [Sorangium cellulosum So0157-2]
MGAKTVTVILVPNDSDACYDAYLGPCLEHGELPPSQGAQACTAVRL